MSPQQALKLLDGVSANYKGTRQDHIKLQEAVGCLSGVIAEYDIMVKEEEAAENGKAADPKKIDVKQDGDAGSDGDQPADDSQEA